MLLEAVVDGDDALVTDAEFLRQFGLESAPMTMCDMWRHIVETLNLMPPMVSTESLETMEFILDHGPLARRILRRVGEGVTRPALQGVYRDLCDCLGTNELFE
jgi:hypothetical protein